MGKTPMAEMRVCPELTIGRYQFDFPVVQAALSGYSDWPMRKIAREHGAPYTLCEVVLDQFLLSPKQCKATRQALFFTEDEHPIGAQLMGAEPHQFAAGAVRLVDAGFDVIDINFGCPVKKVLGRCRGGFHLGQPHVALEIVRRTRDVVPPHIPVTVKMRRGVDDTARSRDNFFEIVDGAFAAGVAAITVHPRTVQQRYVGSSCWSFLAEVKRHVGARTILGSGDLFSAPDGVAMLLKTGIDGLSVARGGIANPWIFSQIRALMSGEPLPPAPSVRQQGDVIRRHYEYASEFYGGERCGRIMRKFGIKYATLHPRTADVRIAFTRVRRPEDWLAVLDRWYTDDLPGQYPPGDVHRVNACR
jgi:tRNA-dihydrouridine synthase B